MTGNLVSVQGFFQSRKKEIILSLFAILFAFLFCLPFVETYFWYKRSNSWVVPHTIFDPELGWANPVNTKTVFENVTYTGNALGFRSEEIDLAREHILILGDSVAFGLGVNDDEAASYILGQEFKKYQTLNLAVSGYGIDQYYLALRRHIGKTRPKYVVAVLFPTNDLNDTRRDNLNGIQKPFFVEDQGRLVNMTGKLSRFSCQNIFAKSWILEQLGMNGRGKEICGERNLINREGFWVVFSLFIKIRNLAFQYGAKPLFVLSPSMGAVKHSICELKGKPFDCETLDSGFAESYERFLKRIRRNRFEYIDFKNELILKSRDNVLESFYRQSGKDSHHYSPLGNELLAETISRRLKEIEDH